MSEKPYVPINCFFKGSYNPVYTRAIERVNRFCFKYNYRLHSPEKREKMIRALFGAAGKAPVVTPPFWCDFGGNIEVGDNFYSNHNLVITDGAKVVFGDNVFIAPNCCITTAEHAIDPDMRRQGIEIAKPITVGSNVWIGAGSVVLAGVTIGDNSVIGAGSVVTRDIPPNVVALGVPCRVLRQITEEDKKTYPMYE